MKEQTEIEKERQEVLDIIGRYAKTWTLLIQYDENACLFPCRTAAGAGEKL